MGERGENPGRMAPEDPLRALVVERMGRADGRYLLYYRWPGRDSDPLAPGAASKEGLQEDDV